VPFYENPELLRLFQVYTASPQSIGSHFAQAVGRSAAHDPLLVATGQDIAFYPGGGEPPSVQGFRVSTRGFKEIAAISHLGPALATLVRMKELDEAGPWRTDAVDLLRAARSARAANSTELWRDYIAVAAFAGRESAIAAMVGYACRLTERVLERALADGNYLTAARLREDYLEGSAPDVPVPMNRVMVATFFLTGLDLAHRLINWFDELALPWERAMVIIAGRQGRPTAGITRDTNSIAGVIETASRGRLPSNRLLIAPHAPAFPQFDGTNLDAVAALERDYRLMWSGLQATSQLGELMFAGFPRFEAEPRSRGAVGFGSSTVSEMPAVSGPDDWFAMTTRLRVVLEDPRQLLSGAVTDFAGQQLIDHANRPEAVVVPGLDGEPYPRPSVEPAEVQDAPTH
jgi:hypothetical protein